jgi:hypothetical protein
LFANPRGQSQLLQTGVGEEVVVERAWKEEVEEIGVSNSSGHLFANRHAQN